MKKSLFDNQIFSLINIFGTVLIVLFLLSSCAVASNSINNEINRKKAEQKFPMEVRINELEKHLKNTYGEVIAKSIEYKYLGVSVIPSGGSGPIPDFSIRLPEYSVDSFKRYAFSVKTDFFEKPYIAYFSNIDGGFNKIDWGKGNREFPLSSEFKQYFLKKHGLDIANYIDASFYMNVTDTDFGTFEGEEYIKEKAFDVIKVSSINYINYDTHYQTKSEVEEFLKTTNHFITNMIYELSDATGISFNLNYEDKDLQYNAGFYNIGEDTINYIVHVSESYPNEKSYDGLSWNEIDQYGFNVEYQDYKERSELNPINYLNIFNKMLVDGEDLAELPIDKESLGTVGEKIKFLYGGINQLLCYKCNFDKKEIYLLVNNNGVVKEERLSFTLNSNNEITNINIDDEIDLVNSSGDILSKEYFDMRNNPKDFIFILCNPKFIPENASLALSHIFFAKNPDFLFNGLLPLDKYEVALPRRISNDKFLINVFIKGCEYYDEYELKIYVNDGYTLNDVIMSFKRRCNNANETFAKNILELMKEYNYPLRKKGKNRYIYSIEYYEEGDDGMYLKYKNYGKKKNIINNPYYYMLFNQINERREINKTLREDGVFNNTSRIIQRYGLKLVNSYKGIGDKIIAGRQTLGLDSYAQYGKDLEWVIVDKDETKFLLVANCLCAYDGEDDNVNVLTYESSRLRHYLNNFFEIDSWLNKHTDFLPLILNSKQINSKTNKYGKSFGRDTDDRIFILSEAEINDILGKNYGGLFYDLLRMNKRKLDVDILVRDVKKDGKNFATMRPTNSGVVYNYYNDIDTNKDKFFIPAMYLSNEAGALFHDIELFKDYSYGPNKIYASNEKIETSESSDIDLLLKNIDAKEGGDKIKRITVDKNIGISDRIYFGNDLIWQVIAKDDLNPNKVLIMLTPEDAEVKVGKMNWSDSDECGYKDSKIRKYLNETFLREFFKQEDINRMFITNLVCKVENWGLKEEIYYVDDRMFVLSDDDIKKYYDTLIDPIKTSYVRNQRFDRKQASLYRRSIKGKDEHKQDTYHYTETWGVYPAVWINIG